MSDRKKGRKKMSDRKNSGMQRIKLSDVRPDPSQMIEPQVTGWFFEIELGLRTPESELAALDQVRPNPFATSLDVGIVSEFVELLREGKLDPTLWVARLPEGGFIDVDTAYVCEAARRAGIAVVNVLVAGDFSPEDCIRIGIR